jgi:predicted hotdog family 3-hydroxylacyl-ACP dehydratase
MSTEITSDKLRPMIGMPASTFVLHREPMLFLDRLVDISADSAACEWNIHDDFELVVPGCGVPAYAGVEYMAQCVAVHAGARARAQGLIPPYGYLLGTRHYRCSVPWFETGVSYRSTCRELVRDSQGMGSFECRILLDGASIAEANLAVLERPQEIKLDE